MVRPRSASSIIFSANAVFNRWLADFRFSMSALDPVGTDSVASIAPVDTAPPIGREAVPEPTWTLIRPGSPWQLVDLRECWHYRDLLMLLIRRDVQVRYRQAVLGAAWAVLQPAMMMVLFTMYFARMAKLPSDGMPYPVFVYVGLLQWSFFQSAVSTASNSIITSEKLISKIYIPRILIPLAAVGAALVDFVIALLLLVILMVVYRVPLGHWAFLFPLVFAGILLVSLGVGTMLAALNVAYRDFRYIVPFLLQLWLFATPTIYLQPERSSDQHGIIHFVLRLNPMTGLIGCGRATLLGRPVDWDSLALSALSTAVFLIIGLLYFRRTEDRFADII
jgi:lipopolysaccharide transport system permease protein